MDAISQLFRICVICQKNHFKNQETENMVTANSLLLLLSCHPLLSVADTEGL